MKGDTIYRQDAIDALSTPHGILYPIRTIVSLPAAQPERKQAKWIVGGIEEDSGYLGSRWYECERCHTPGDLSDKFCRGCGAEMQT